MDDADEHEFEYDDDHHMTGMDALGKDHEKEGEEEGEDDDEESAAAAYAAITSQLAEWGGGGGGKSSLLFSTPSDAAFGAALSPSIRPPPSSSPFLSTMMRTPRATATTPLPRIMTAPRGIAATPYGRHTPSLAGTGAGRTPMPVGDVKNHPFYGGDDDYDEGKGEGRGYAEDDYDDNNDDDDDYVDDYDNMEEQGGPAPLHTAASAAQPATSHGPSLSVRWDESATPARTLDGTGGGPRAHGSSAAGAGDVFTPSSAVRAPGSVTSSFSALASNRHYSGAPIRTPGSAAVFGTSSVSRNLEEAAKAVVPFGGYDDVDATELHYGHNHDHHPDPNPRHDVGPGMYDPNDVSDRPYLPYLDALLAYRKCRAGLEERARLLDEEEELAAEEMAALSSNKGHDAEAVEMEIAMERQNRDMNRDRERAELGKVGTGVESKFLAALADACRDRSDELRRLEDGDCVEIGTGGGGAGGTGTTADDDGNDQRARAAEETKLAEQECDLWSLIASLRSLGMNSLLYDYDSGGENGGIGDDDTGNVAAAAESNHVSQLARLNEHVQIVSMDADRDPADVVRSLLGIGGGGGGEDQSVGVDEECLSIPTPPLILLRRSALLRWIESCHNRRIEDSGGVVDVAAIRETTTMWVDTVSALRKRRREAGKVADFHLDAPFASCARGAGGDGVKTAMLGLFGSDDETDAELLGSCLALIKAGDLDGAMDLCRRSGQSWRAAAWSGGDPYGTATKADRTEEEEEEGAEEKKMSYEGRAATGNPSRALWKRTMWKQGRALLAAAATASAASYSTTSSVGRGRKQTSSSLPITVESAICALLVDDVCTSLDNPRNRTWLDAVLIHLRASVNRTVDEALHRHSERRRAVGRRYPYPGSEFRVEELEHLALTSPSATTPLVEMGMTEADPFDAAEQSDWSEVRSEAEEDALRRGCRGFAAGAGGIASFLAECAEALLAVPADGGTGEDEEDAAAAANADSLRRFLVHLLLYLDDVAPDFVDSVSIPSVAYDAAGNEGGGQVRVRDAILLSYVRHMTHPSRRALWHIATPYASLLRPAGTLVRAQSAFLVRINDTRFRRSVLEQMREHMRPGMDLLIIRRAVRDTLDSKDGVLEGTDDGFPLAALLDPAPVTRAPRRGGAPSPRRREDVATADDVRRMHVVRWLTAYPEHRPDAVIWANSLLRRFLLAGSRGRTDEVGLDLARIFLSRFVPPDAEIAAMDYYAGRVANGEEVALSNPFVPSYDVAKDAESELGAIRAYIVARDAFVGWKRVVKQTSPESLLRPALSVERFGLDGENSTYVEDPIASKMEKRAYLRRKLEAGQKVMVAALEARERLMGVLEYPGGWLLSGSEVDSAALALSDPDAVADAYGGDVDLAAEERAASDDWRREHAMEIASLRSQCLPLSTSLLHVVLDETGRWMEEFEFDAIRKYGKDEGRRSIRGLLDEGDDGGMDEEGAEKVTPLMPQYWHRAAVGLAAVVAANDANGLLDVFEEENRKKLAEAAIESAVRLLLCTRG